jgi:hypothetical protein
MYFFAYLGKCVGLGDGSEVFFEGRLDKVEAVVGDIVLVGDFVADRVGEDEDAGGLVERAWREEPEAVTVEEGHRFGKA